VATALSSTMIVVKIMYDKFELTTLPGRITLGILVFQDIWAILFLSIQPSLLSPGASIIVLSFLKGVALVVLTHIPHPLSHKKSNFWVQFTQDGRIRVWYPRLDECGYQQTQFG
jgi:Kef-type K+ transport system membrane component KefB